jgi:hypothetical protein
MAVVSDQNAFPADIVRRLPEGVRVRLLQNFDRVEVNRDAERRVRLVAGKQEGATVRGDLHRRLTVAGPALGVRQRERKGDGLLERHQTSGGCSSDDGV